MCGATPRFGSRSAERRCRSSCRRTLRLQREVGNPRHKRPLRPGIRLPVQAKLPGQALLQTPVFGRDRGMRAQIVAEGDRPDPLRAAEWHQVEMMRAKSKGRLAE